MKLRGCLKNIAFPLAALAAPFLSSCASSASGAAEVAPLPTSALESPRPPPVTSIDDVLDVNSHKFWEMCAMPPQKKVYFGMKGGTKIYFSNLNVTFIYQGKDVFFYSDSSRTLLLVIRHNETMNVPACEGKGAMAIVRGDSLKGANEEVDLHMMEGYFTPVPSR